MAELNGNENQNGVFGGVKYDGQIGENTSYFEENNQQANASSVFGNFGVSNNGNYEKAESNSGSFQPIEQKKAITKQGLWSKVKSFLFQEIDLNAPIKVELTPYQQKVEDEINEFLHQEITFKSIANIFKGKK